MSDRAIVTGGSIAALATADALASAGHPVELLAPAKGVGAGFAPMRKDGRALELGVRLLELQYEGVTADAVPPLAAYDPGIGGHRPYTPLIAAWAAERAGERLVAVPRPRMVVDGRVVDDLYFTTDAAVLRDAASPQLRKQIAAQAAALADASGDAGPLAPDAEPALTQRTLADASLACHGAAFHERFIEPYAAKVVAGGTAAVVAHLRRKAWVPLFWPRTLAQACGDGPVAFTANRPFSTISGGGAGQIVELLLARLAASPHACVRTVGALTAVAAADRGAVRLEFSDGEPVVARRPVLGNAPAELFAAAGIAYAPEKARSVIVWLEVDGDDVAWLPSLLNVADASSPILRVSSGGAASASDRQLLTVELAHDQDPQALAPMLGDELARYGVLRDGADITVVMAVAAPTFALPHRENVDRFAEARAQWDARELDADLVGGAADFAADAFNEQIIQALKITQERT